MPASIAPIIAGGVAAVTPSDTTVQPFTALYIGTTGDVAILPNNGVSAVTFKSVAVGFFPVSGQKVMNTNTTASNIVALT